MSQKHNFDFFKDDFKKDCKMDATSNIELYIQYYNARVNDLTMQSMSKIYDIINIESRLMPDTFKSKVSIIAKHLTKEG